MDNRFLYILLGFLVVAFTLCNYTSSIQSKEGFLGTLPTMVPKVMRQVNTPNGGSYSIPDQYQTMFGTMGIKKGDFAQTGGTFQSMLSPRFSNVDYGANIRYNMPGYENQGVPCNPLGMSKMAREGYTPGKQVENYGCGYCGGGCGATGCKKGGESPDDVKGYNPVLGDQAGFSAGNYGSVAQSQGYAKYGPQFNQENAESLSMLPVGTMTSVGSDGQDPGQVIITDQLIFANRRSRLRSLGDPIRGDLACVPAPTGWFRPSVTPQIDLQEGAMGVLAGVDNQTYKDLAAFMAESSDNTYTTLGGINVANTNLSSQFQTSSANAVSDVITRAYP